MASTTALSTRVVSPQLPRGIVYRGLGPSRERRVGHLEDRIHGDQARFGHLCTHGRRNNTEPVFNLIEGIDPIGQTF